MTTLQNFFILNFFNRGQDQVVLNDNRGLDHSQNNNDPDARKSEDIIDITPRARGLIGSDADTKYPARKLEPPSYIRYDAIYRAYNRNVNTTLSSSQDKGANVDIYA